MEPRNPSSDPAELADIFTRVEAGDPAAKDALFATLYAELHRIAEAHLRRSRGQVTLGTTTLLHEAYVDMNRNRATAFPDRLRFLKYASRAMRGLIIDYARTRRAQKRGGEITFTSLDEATHVEARAGMLEDIGQALEGLATIDASLAELVDLKFFCGFSFAEIAAMRGTSERTEQREWAKARLLLLRALTGEARDLLGGE